MTCGYYRTLSLWVPRTSSTSRDQAILVDQATDASPPSDAVPLKIDRFGQRFQRCRAVQETVRPGFGFILPAAEAERRFAAEVPSARVMDIDANHYTITTHDDSIAAIGAFLRTS